MAGVRVEVVDIVDDLRICSDADSDGILSCFDVDDFDVLDDLLVMARRTK